MYQPSTRAGRIAAASAAAVLSLVGAGALQFYSSPTHAETALLPHSATTTPPVEVTGLPNFTKLVDAVGPAVVNIRTTERVVTPQYYPGLPGMDQNMLEFLRQFGFPIPGQLQQQPTPKEAPQSRIVPSGVGSGFIISPDGYILTNQHVIAGAADVYVTLTDHREFKAKVIGSDRRTDIALLKIDAKDLPTVRIGNDKQLRVGQWVVAIGSPFGLDNTVTAGIVSAKSRDTGSYLPFIQTDVAVNPGNSGGPLINMQGEVVGMNNQIYSRSGGFMGISFAIPIDDAIRVSEQLKKFGHVVRSRIGVRISPVNPDVAQSLGLQRDATGAVVASVEPNSPAAKAGIKAGDIIISFDGKKFENSSDLPRIVGDTPPGTTVKMEVFRAGKMSEMPITVEEIPADEANGQGNADQKASGLSQHNHFGLAVRALPEQQREDLGIAGGVLVASTTGAAAEAGIRQGDVILAVGQTPVHNIKAFDEAIAKTAKKGPLSVLVRRDGIAQYVLIRQGEFPGE